VLEVQQARKWHHIVTLDGSWFDFSMDHEWICLIPKEPVPDREQYLIAPLKLMITVV
jgi:hypothetical protein